MQSQHQSRANWTNIQNIKKKEEEVGGPQKIERLTKLFETWHNCVRNELSIGNGKWHCSLLGFNWAK
jgi:hypothetical protein